MLVLRLRCPAPSATADMSESAARLRRRPGGRVLPDPACNRLDQRQLLEAASNDGGRAQGGGGDRNETARAQA